MAATEEGTVEGGRGRTEGFDRSAAVTRSLLGYGVLAGVVYLGVGIALAATRAGFEPTRHALSLLMLGEGGWMQRVNLIVAGAMVIAAGAGFGRALRSERGGVLTARLVVLYGLSLVAAAAFAPDPVAGFPPGAGGDDASTAGVLHLVAGAIGFLALAAAAAVAGSSWSQRGEGARAAWSRISAAVVIVGSVSGAAMATRSVGVLALWIAVVVGWAWLAVTAIQLYRGVPHPDAARREPSAP